MVQRVHPYLPYDSASTFCCPRAYVKQPRFFHFNVFLRCVEAFPLGAGSYLLSAHIYGITGIYIMVPSLIVWLALALMLYVRLPCETRWAHVQVLLFITFLRSSLDHHRQTWTT